MKPAEYTMSTVCQPGVRLVPVFGSLVWKKSSVEALNSLPLVPLCQATAFTPVTGSACTASRSPSCGQAAPLVSQNDVQSAIVLGLPGRAGKLISASITPDEYACGLISATHLPVAPVVEMVASPLASVPTLPSGTPQDCSVQKELVWFHDVS